MATTSKKKKVDQSIDRASRQSKSGINYSARQAKDISHKTIDLTRNAKHRAKRSLQKSVNASGEAIERAGRSIQRAGRNVKKAA